MPTRKGVGDARVKNKDPDTIVEFVFDYQRVPTKVGLHLKQSIAGKSFWAFVQRI